MKFKRIVSYLLLSAITNFWGYLFAVPITSPENFQMSLIEQEAKFEKEKGEYLQQYVLDKILGPGKAIVIVDIELGIETKTINQSAKEKKTEKKKRLGEIEYLLPGVPNPKSVSQESSPGESKEEAGQAEETKVEIRTIIKKLIITIIHDEKVPKDKLNAVKDAIIASMKINTARGDKIEFKKSKFTPDFFDELLKPGVLIPVIIAILVLFFLFGPVASFLRSYVRTLRERGGTEVTVDSKFEGGPGGENGEEKQKELLEGAVGGEEILTQEQQEQEQDEKYIPFSYVNDENLRQLIYLIRKEEPRMIALVVSYLKPEYVKEILGSLDGEMQAKVAVEMATVRLMTQEQLMKFDEELKKKIDYVIGGLDHLVEVLEKVDRVTLENILDYLKDEKPDLYEKVRKFIITFDDIPNFPDQAMQVIIRELKPESIARALRNASNEVMNKFFSNMSSSAAAIIKEEMEYGRPVSEEEVEEERKKIVDLIKGLEKEGKIFIREKPKSAILEGSGDIVSEDESEAVGSLEDYYLAGVESYEAGRYEEAISYFEYCISIDGSQAVFYQYLGNSYYALGRMEEAINAYEEAIRLDPGNEELKNWLANEKSKQKVS